MVELRRKYETSSWTKDKEETEKWRVLCVTDTTASSLDKFLQPLITKMLKLFTWERAASLVP